MVSEYVTITIKQAIFLWHYF